MDHKSFEELQLLLQDAATKVRVGGAYAHYKDPNSRYVVAGLSILEATDEVAVKYASSQKPEVEFVRPLSSWLADVEWDGTTMPRFTLAT